MKGFIGHEISNCASLLSELSDIAATVIDKKVCSHPDKINIQVKVRTSCGAS